MVRTKDIGIDYRIVKPFLQAIGYQKIINTPPCIFFPCVETVGPPRINALLIRIEIAEGIDKSIFQKSCKLSSFLIGKASIFMV